jgi:hypothetical protein
MPLSQTIVINLMCYTLLSLVLYNSISWTVDRSRKVASQLHVLDSSQMEAPALSICQPLLKLFRQCRMIELNHFCHSLTLDECNSKLFVQMNSSKKMFHQARLCLSDRFPIVEALTNAAWLQSSQKRELAWTPVHRYLTLSMYCLHFRGYWDPFTIIFIMLEIKSDLNRTELLVSAYSRTKLMQMYLDYKDDASRKRKSSSPIGEWEVFVHSKMKIVENKFLSFLPIGPEFHNEMVRIFRVKYERLPLPYEDSCHRYDATQYDSQSLCLQRCLNRPGHPNNAYFEWSPDVPFVNYSKSRLSYEANSNLSTLATCFDLCPSECDQEVFRVRSSTHFYHKENQLFVEFEPLSVIIRHNPMLSWSLFTTVTFNQLSFLFGFTMLNGFRLLLRPIRYDCRFHSFCRALHSLCCTVLLGWLVIHTTLLVLEYRRYETVATVRFESQVLRHRLKVSVCFHKQPLVHNRTFRNEYNVWRLQTRLASMKRNIKSMRNLAKNSLHSKAEWRRLMREVNVYHSSQWNEITNELLTYNKSADTSGSRWPRLTNMFDYIRPTSFIENMTFEALQAESFEWFELTLMQPTYKERFLLSWHCVHVQHNEIFYISNSKCFVLTLVQRNCPRHFAQRFVLRTGVTRAANYMGNNMFLAHGISGMFRNMLEVRQELLPPPYETNCRSYDHYSFGHLNVTCNLRHECISLCTIDETLRRFGHLPLNVPFFWPKYSAMIAGQEANVRFVDVANFDRIETMCTQRFAQHDCKSSLFYNEFNDHNEPISKLELLFKSNVQVIRHWVKFSLTDLLLQITGVLSLSIGLSMGVLLRTLYRCIRYVWFGCNKTSSNSLSRLLIRLLLLLGFLIQLYNLSMQVCRATSIFSVRTQFNRNSFQYVPPVSICFKMRRILDKSQMRTGQQQQKWLAFLNFVLRTERDANLTVGDLLDLTLSYEQLFEQTSFIWQQVQQSGEVLTRYRGESGLSGPSTSSAVCSSNLCVQTYLMGRNKCFLFRLLLLPAPQRQPINNPVLKLKMFDSKQLDSVNVHLGSLHEKHKTDDLRDSLYIAYESEYKLRDEQSTFDLYEETRQTDLLEPWNRRQQQLLLQHNHTSLIMPVSQKFRNSRVDNGEVWDLVNLSRPEGAAAQTPPSPIKFRLYVHYFTSRNKSLMFFLAPTLLQTQHITRDPYTNSDLVLFTCSLLNSWFEVTAVDLASFVLRKVWRVVVRATIQIAARLK